MTRSLHSTITSPSLRPSPPPHCSTALTPEEEEVQDWLAEVGMDQYHDHFVRAGYDLPTISRYILFLLLLLLHVLLLILLLHVLLPCSLAPA